MISRRHFLTSSLAASAGFASSTNLASPLEARNISRHGDGYVRIFPAGPATQPGSILEHALSDLVDTMKTDSGENGSIAAGYTYFGQFIDHDLTLDITPLDQVTSDITQVRNFRSPFLDLEHLYGGGPSVAPFLYRKQGPDSPKGAERFLLGATTPSSVSTCNDLPRNPQGIALVGDARQDENLVIAQLHVAFLKLHNFVINDRNLLKPYLDAGSDFAAAQRLVTWHYQWLVRNDFLKTILDPDVFKYLDSPDYKPLFQWSKKGFQIPVEFSAAAFRFGHSMVRNDYFHNDNHLEAKLVDDLFQRTGFGKAGNVPLPQEWVADWIRFFPFPSPHAFDAQRARRIDTNIADGLFHLLPSQVRAFSMAPTSKAAFAPDPPELPLRTLLRGSRMGLPSGERIAPEVGRQMRRVRLARNDEITRGAGGPVLTDPKKGLRGNTPLWYYVLKEAEILHEGGRLGPVGSRIVGDVIVAALAADPKSYLRVAGPKWQPTLWTPELWKDPLEEISKMLTLVAPAQVAQTWCDVSPDHQGK
jgi:hypothetical protein